MHVDLILPARKRFTKSFPLYGPIDPAASTYKILGTKCEITLAKADARSWPSITTLDPELAKKFQIRYRRSQGDDPGPDQRRRWTVTMLREAQVPVCPSSEGTTLSSLSSASLALSTHPCRFHSNFSR